MTEGLDFTPRQERIAELYYVSNSVNFKDGPFKFSVHQDNPNLPLSPNKLHYPDDGKPGSEYLPELFSLVGDELFEVHHLHLIIANSDIICIQKLYTAWFGKLGKRKKYQKHQVSANLR